MLRSLAGILAGANQMPWRQFMVANAVGAVAWSSFFGFAAYMFGRQVHKFAGPLVITIGIVALIAVVAGAILSGGTRRSLSPKPSATLPGPLKSA